MAMKKNIVALSIVCSTLAASVALAQGDPEVIQQIIREGKNNNHVWDHLLYLSEEIGPRLTGSSRQEEASNWTRDQFDKWGLSNAHLKQWGTLPVRFDRGPSSAQMVEPVERVFEFTSPAWSAGTDGSVRGKVFKQPETIEALEAIEDQLEDAWILSKPRQRRRRGAAPPGANPEIREEINQRLKDAGIAGRIVPNRGELVGTFGQRGWRELDFNNLPSEVTVNVRRSDYDAMNSRMADGEEVVVEIDLQHTFVEGPISLYNTIAEIPGTELPDEVVIVSGHLDSWDGPGSMGTQDNGTGISVALEAARILRAVGAKPMRTIRFILWTGEEQGLLGSRAYVQNLSEEERAGISAVFVDDGGTNYEGGLVCIESMADMLRQATAPVNEAFPDMPVQIVVRSNMPRGGGSDHASFNRQGIPGFFWMESGSGGREGKNYGFIHHTQHDTPRYAVPEYLVQSSTCAAITAYNLAMADTLLPRQPQEVPVVTETETAAAETKPPADWEPAEGPLSGAWEVTVGESGRTFTMFLEMSKDNRVRGKTESERGTGTIPSGSFDPETGVLKFVLETSGIGDINFTATVKGESMEGTMSVPDIFEGEFTAKRTDAANKDDGGGQDG